MYCDHKGDADFIGARNVLTKTRAALGRVYSQRWEMPVIQGNVSGQTVRLGAATLTCVAEVLTWFHECIS
jgi:hypothetical protein